MYQAEYHRSKTPAGSRVIRPPPAVLTTSSADVDARNNKERENECIRELAASYSLAAEFCWFQKPITSLPVGQDLMRSLSSETQSGIDEQWQQLGREEETSFGFQC
jgi:hypothetical protein